MRHFAFTLIALAVQAGEAKAADSHILSLNIPNHYHSHLTFKSVSISQSTVMGKTTTTSEQDFDQQIDMADPGYRIERQLTSAHVDMSGTMASQQKLSQIIADIPEVDYSTDAELKPVAVENIDAIKTYLSQALVATDPGGGKLVYDTGFSTLDATSAASRFARDDIPVSAVRNIALTVGQPIQLPSQSVTAMGGVFHLEGLAVLKTWDETTGTAHIIFTQQPTDDEIKAFMAASLHKLFDKLPGAHSVDIDAAIKDSQLTYAMTCEADIDIATGLPKRSACATTVEQIMDPHLTDFGKITTSWNVTGTREYTSLP